MNRKSRIFSLLLAVTMVFTVVTAGAGTTVFAQDSEDEITADLEQPGGESEAETETEAETEAEVEATPATPSDIQPLGGNIAPFGIEEGSCGDGVKYAYDDVSFELTISYTGSGTGAMDDFSVYTSRPWYNYAGNIKTVVIEDGVIDIGRMAFMDLANLTDVTIGNDVQTIGNRAFSDCTALESIIFGSDITGIYGSAFNNCTALAEIIFLGNTPPSTIVSDAFANIATGGAVYYPDGANTAYANILVAMGITGSWTATPAAATSGSCGASAYWNYDPATKAFEVTGTGAMYDYSMLSQRPWDSFKADIKTVEIADGITLIGIQAFSRCIALDSVTIPNSVKIIGVEAFAGCLTLKNATLGRDLIAIDGGAFQNCTGLENLEIGSGVQTIGSSAFAGCTKLESITIPDSVQTIDTFAFAGCTKLESITIPNSVNTIGDYAFEGCTKLKSVTIGSGVGSIRDQAFRGCTKLAEITFLRDTPPTFTTNDFTGVAGTGTVYYPLGKDTAYSSILTTMQSAGLPSTGWTARGGTANSGQCGANAYWNYNPATKTLSITGTGLMDGYITRSDRPWNNIALNEIKKVEIASGITSIGKQAFEDFSGIESVNIPNSVEFIGRGAFYGWSALKNVVLPNKVDTIGVSTFNGCTNLESVTLPTGLKIIERYAFYECKAFKSITIPNSVETINERAFSGCNDLDEITFLCNTPPTIDSSAFTNVNSTGTIYYPPAATGFDDAWKNSIGLAGWTLTPIYTPTPPPSAGGDDSGDSGSYIPAKAGPATTLVVTAEKAKAAVSVVNTGTGKAAISHTGGIKVLAEAWEVFGNTPVNFDSVADKAVQVRIAVDVPRGFAKDLMLGGSVAGPDNDRRKAMFEKWFGNKIQVICLEQPITFGRPVQIAAKADFAGADIKSLVFYSYDQATHSYTKILNPNARLDANGYLHFTTTLAGDIVVSAGELVKK